MKNHLSSTLARLVLLVIGALSALDIRSSIEGELSRSSLDLEETEKREEMKEEKLEEKLEALMEGDPSSGRRCLLRPIGSTDHSSRGGDLIQM